MDREANSRLHFSEIKVEGTQKVAENPGLGGPPEAAWRASIASVTYL